MYRVVALVAAALLGVAGAVPREPHHHEKNHGHWHHYPSAIGSHAPIGTGTAPVYQNATKLGGKHHTKHLTITSTYTVRNTQFRTVIIEPAATNTHDGNTQAAEDKHVVEPGTGSDTGAGTDTGSGTGGEECKEPVTITVANTNTVTVTAGAEPAGPTIKPKPEAVEHKQDAVQAEKVAVNTPAPISSHAAPAKPAEKAEPIVKPKPQAPEEPKPASSSVAAPVPKASDVTQAPANDADTASPQKGLPFRTKRGIMSTGANVENLAKAMGVGKVSWVGDWYSGPPHDIAPSLTFVPQNYGPGSDTNNQWTNNAAKAIKRGEKYFLSFGEPSTHNAQYMSPATAVQQWRATMEPYAKQGITIGAPGVLQNPSDLAWLHQFVDLCTDCTIGFVAIHWFYKAEAGLIPGFKQLLYDAKAIADKLGVKVWLDNFCASGTQEEQQAFLGEVVPWMDAQDWIDAYAYVPDASGHGMVEGDVINSMGEFYANL